MGDKVKDLSSMKFGRWVVLQREGTNNSGNATWRTRCVCGNEAIVSGSNLLRGHSTSCGCYKRELLSQARRINLENQRFGRLIAISPHGKSKDGRIMWRCVCDCGNIVSASSSQLRSGNTKSCGCYHKDRITKHGLSGTKEYDRARVNKRNEKKKKLDSLWTAAMEMSLSKFYPSCMICGSTDRLCTDHVYPLDRGYGLKPGNAIKLCTKCNSGKRNKLPSELPRDIMDKVLSAADRFLNHWNVTGGK